MKWNDQDVRCHYIALKLSFKLICMSSTFNVLMWPGHLNEILERGQDCYRSCHEITIDETVITQLFVIIQKRSATPGCFVLEIVSDLFSDKFFLKLFFFTILFDKFILENFTDKIFSQKKNSATAFIMGSLFLN